MNQEDLDFLLPNEENIVPSSRFVANVMDAVEHAASTPLPIPFPWKYAIRGFAASIIVFLSFVALGFGRSDVSSTGSPVPRIAPMLTAIIEGLKAIEAGWIAVALLVSAASVFLSLRIARA